MLAKQRAVQAMQYRIEGLTYERIAEILGYSSRAAVHVAVDRELGRIAEHTTAKMRRMELERINALYAVAMPKALSGDLWAMDRILAIQARLAKLYNLDISPNEVMAAMPYQKRIVLEDTPSVPAIGEVVE